MSDPERDLTEAEGEQFLNALEAQERGLPCQSEFGAAARFYEELSSAMGTESVTPADLKRMRARVNGDSVPVPDRLPEAFEAELPSWRLIAAALVLLTAGLFYFMHARPVAPQGAATDPSDTERRQVAGDDDDKKSEEQKTEDPELEKRVAELVRQLGDENFQTRSRAAAELVKQGASIKALLESHLTKLARDPKFDPEIKVALQKALQTIHSAEVESEIREVIKDLNRAVEQSPALYVPPNLETEKQLSRKIPFQHPRARLEVVLAKLKEEADIPLVLDPAISGKEEIPNVVIQEGNWLGGSLRSIVLLAGDFDYVVRGKVIVVTSQSRALLLRQRPDRTPASELEKSMEMPFTPAELERLADRLGDQDSSKREEALRALLRMGRVAWPALENHCQRTKDPAIKELLDLALKPYRQEFTAFAEMLKAAAEKAGTFRHNEAKDTLDAFAAKATDPEARKLAGDYAKLIQDEGLFFDRCRTRLKDQIGRDPNHSSPQQLFNENNLPIADLVDFDERGITYAATKGGAGGSRLREWSSFALVQPFKMLQNLRVRKNAPEHLALASVAFHLALKAEAEARKAEANSSTPASVQSLKGIAEELRGEVQSALDAAVRTDASLRDKRATQRTLMERLSELLAAPPAGHKP